ncbi:MAG: ABC transporter ATP-binding protein/permease [Treponema sp.]|nr:ABC transporter ATP-binding protein/permease [Treponema sp.]MCL2272906.1 ABC transporter ATP-binding protein/permease [Treponema sp.]
MTLPWKGGKVSLIAAAATDRKFRFFICCAATLGTVAFAIVNPQIIRYTIDSVIGTAPLEAPAFIRDFLNLIGGAEALRGKLWICALFIAGTALLAEICNFVRNFTGSEMGETIAWRLLNTLYAHIQKLPWSWHVKCQTGDIIQRSTTDVDNIRNFIQNNLSELLRTFCIFIFAVLMMFSMDVFMSIIGLSLIPVILTFSILYFRKVSKKFELAEVTEGQMQAVAQENYTGVRVVRAFGREAWEMNKFSEKTRQHADNWINIGKMLGIFWGAGDIMSGLQLVVIIAAGIFRCVQGELTPGTFLAFYSYSGMMIWPVRQLGRIISDLSKTLVAAQRIREVLAAEPETDPPDALYPEIKGEIRFENVSFAYGENIVLRDISFTLKPGETMAILGATGSGKSSLVHLLSRLYDIEEGNGAIKIDGIDIRKIARSHLRKNIGLCLQEPFLFSKTIRENIRAAQKNIEIEEIKKASSTAMVHDTIEGFSGGYDTLIGERGVTLSGGQKQRVAIARMLAGKAPVMIFDDSLSAVDTETDAKIRAALKHQVRDAAAIIISHRISTLMQADKILVLKNNTVEDIGSHNELLGREGTYRRIFEMQAAGLGDASADTGEGERNV